METVVQASPADKLKDLKNNRLFWFLKDKDVSKVEQDIRHEEFPFGSVYIETLGSGSEGKMNEDAPLVLDMGRGRVLLAVLDAASSQKKIESLDREGISGAFYVSHLASFGFEASQEYKDLCAMDDLSAGDIMIDMNKWLYGKMLNVPGVDYSDIPSVPGMAAVFLLVDPIAKRLSIAQVADAVAAVVKSEGTTEVITPNLNERFDKETMDFVYEQVKEFKSDLPHIRQIPEAKENIRLQLADSFTRKTNKKGGMGIMNGMTEMVTNHLFYTNNFYMDEKISSILLYSDGAILPYMEKGVSQDKAAENFAKSIYGKTNKSPIKDGAAILEADSDFTKVPRMKKRDDATVIAVRFK